MCLCFTQNTTHLYHLLKASQQGFLVLTFTYRNFKCNNAPHILGRYTDQIPGPCISVRLELATHSDFTIAIAAIHRLVATWFEGYFGVLAALSAHYRKHLAGGAVASVSGTLRLPGLATRRTALWVVGIAPGRKEFLLVSAESEGSSAVGTLDGLILKTHWMTSFYS